MKKIIFILNYLIKMTTLNINGNNNDPYYEI